MKIDTQLQWFGGPFLGPFLSNKSVVCRSKMSWGPSGHPKSTKVEVRFWYKFDIFWRWLGQAVHRNQCVCFPQYFMLFQQFCFSVVGEYGWRKAHLCLRATTFYALPVPLPRQVFIVVQMGVWKWGRRKCWKSGSKGSPNGPQKLLKIDKSVFWRGLKKRPQKWTLSRIRKSEILQLFTTL